MCGEARRQKWRQQSQEKKGDGFAIMTGQKFNGINCLTCFRDCEFSTNLLNWLTWIFLSSCSAGTRPVFSTLQTGVCWCTTPVCAIFRPVTSIPASWRSHSMDLRTEYIFITKYITMAIKTSNTKLIIPVVMIRIVALLFFTFTRSVFGNAALFMFRQQ